MKSFNKFFDLLIYGFIFGVLVVLAVLGIRYYRSIQKPIVPSLPPSSSAVTAATQLAQMTVTPGVDSDGQLPTAIPWTDSFRLGDQEVLTQAIHNLYATKSFDLRISTVNTYGGVGIYCIAQYLPIPLTGAKYDPNQSMAPQVSDQGKWVILPGSRYCSMWLVMGELWGGVIQRDLQTASVYTPQTKPSYIPPNQSWILLTPTDQTTDNELTRTHEHTQTASVELHLPFGLLTSSIQPKNQLKKTLGPAPNGLVVELINGVNWLKDKPQFQTVADAADTYARWLAQYDMIAPIGPNGSRDTSNLNKLKEDMDTAFSNPSLTGSKYPYDNLRADMEIVVKNAGYLSLDSFTVVLEWPYHPGEWITLESLADKNSLPVPVIKPDDLDFNKDNLYVLFSEDVEKEMTWDKVPDWARSWFHLPPQ